MIPSPASASPMVLPLAACPSTTSDHVVKKPMMPMIIDMMLANRATAPVISAKSANILTMAKNIATITEKLVESANSASPPLCTPREPLIK